MVRHVLISYSLDSNTFLQGLKVELDFSYKCHTAIINQF